MAGLPSRIRTFSLPDGDLDALLRSPFAADELAAPDDLVVVIASPDGSRATAEALDVLASMPCIVVGEGHDPAAPPHHTDLVIEPAVATIEDVLGIIEANPIAATTLALLLRGAGSRGSGEGLAAESAAYSVLQAGPEFARWRAATPRRQRPAETEPAVLVDHVGDRLDVVLNRTHVRNALNRALRDGLLAAFSLAAADDSITEVVVRGNGPTFCSGGDLDEFGSFDDPASAHLVRLAGSIGRAIAAVADRTTFVLHGSCAGSGIELPAFAGRVVADPGTTLSLPEVRLGLVPGAGGTVSLTRRVGRQRVALLALGGAAIDAQTALQWGLVDELSEPS